MVGGFATSARMVECVNFFAIHAAEQQHLLFEQDFIRHCEHHVLVVALPDVAEVVSSC